ncbi:tRNA uridine-5-carboxymethylaminomethyl(34) synthesis GTPase MnmE [Eubacterium sp. am_0171]|uniref:tRNA uridine-5-carboxymethylaminomethyl(34) synthesis GTPase MnmE n=1 Tax=unclassified Eubacterium (in: firmicutes) TaxID=2624479 RepID=UPI00102247AD|nr:MULTISPECIES: tRNA uridine-5-carboxymethylaminomethyl(34) synthesis GTPase MnmE [unclassified Eubacterium (in: firmicutes)]MSC85403.1 tRNA uridine-5-carboxymethylaminomethyl(34) synthesis GTPase MnmE [Eubacterium sp. BIOML-A1]MSD07890.1 tRNA uridine-5-carboxymethylaminomethyl(34) synthesis GTPase MnmE [Eubacterium sp. BIOML-A2]RYT13708.1 tRNA uridine-5-carboxymethylaminomethyl(34) synthesis GTPase MnmE [Eubacterium sp. am_0171]
MKKDTIAAISTGMTNSGIGIVRISGPEAFEVIDRIYKGKDRLLEAESHTIHYGYVKDKQETVDEVLVMLMRAPRTFTGEDTVEINCHGGNYVVKRVLETVVRNGARPAEPGEFTKRAFLNGKMDLSQAEAVIDVITSKNEYALKSSISQLKGSVKNKIEDIRNKIIYQTAFIETALDDPEHIDIDGYGEKLKYVIDDILVDIRKLIDSSDSGRIMKEGIQTVIAGKPNAGKSSLLNVLSGRERAIVTDIEGTTRDALEEQIQMGGLTLNMVDTAGIRETDDIIEKMGVDKARDYVENADLIIYVADASRPLDKNDEDIIQLTAGKRCIILLNKSDLETVITKEILQNTIEKVFKKVENAGNYSKDIPMIDISAKEEQGIQEFEEILKTMFLKGEVSFNDQVYITNIRQKAALQDACESLNKVIESIENQMPEDFFSIDLMDAYESLGSITGETIGEDLVNEIFSKFCMGK